MCGRHSLAATEPPQQQKHRRKRRKNKNIKLYTACNARGSDACISSLHRVCGVQVFKIFTHELFYLP